MWLLRAFIEGVGFLTRHVGIIVEWMNFLSLVLRVVKQIRGLVERVRGFVEGMCRFVKWVSRLVKRMRFFVVRSCAGGFWAKRGTRESIPESKREFGKLFTSLYHF